MKIKHAIIVLFSLIDFVLNAQNQFVDKNNTWSIFEVTYDAGNPYNQQNYNLTVHCDTVIGGTLYQKFTKGLEKLGAVRQVGNKVFYIDFTQRFTGNGLNNEFVLYDFDAQVGDVFSFNDTFGSTERKIEITEIDSIEVFGARRKVFYTINNFGFGLEWIDQIGSLKSPIAATYDFFETDWSVLSFIKEDLSCVSSTKSPISSNLLSISPNPASDIVNLSVQNAVITNIILYDLLGNAVLVQDGKQYLDVSSLANGCYYLVCLVNGDRIARKVMVL
jgi:Secretion system C-terminal sorting domain